MLEVSIVQLEYAKPSYVLATLEGLKSSLGKIVIDEDTGQVVIIDNATAIKEMKVALETMESPLKPFVYTLQYAKADVVSETLQARVDAHSVGTVTADVRTNKLIVRAFPGRRQEIEKLIKSLDKPTKEVLVEARVIQVTFRPKYDMGIDWEKDFRSSNYDHLRRASFKGVFLDEENLTSSDNLYSNYARMTFGSFNVNELEFAIRALKQVSETKILSNPKLLVTNNEEAKIHIGDTIPYIISTTSGTGDNAITSEDVRFVDVGIKLNVTPTINDDGFVTMVLKPEISTVTGYTESLGGGIPQVNKTHVETSVMVKDGMTIVLGGLKKDNKVHTQKGLPFLMDIPILGNLFKSTSDNIETTEIVIFITPHILKGDEGYEYTSGSIKPAKSFKTKNSKIR